MNKLLIFSASLAFLLSFCAEATNLAQESTNNHYQTFSGEISKPLSEVTPSATNDKTRANHTTKTARQLMLAIVAAASTQLSAGSHHMSAPSLPQSERDLGHSQQGI